MSKINCQGYIDFDVVKEPQDDFDNRQKFEVHKRENNPESQEHLEENRMGFSKQCTYLYKLLQTGVRLSVLDAGNQHSIGSLPRRVKDLNDSNYFKSNGLHVNSDWEEVNGKRHHKVYYI